MLPLPSGNRPTDNEMNTSMKSTWKGFHVAPLILGLATAPLAAQGFSGKEAVRRMKVPDGFEVKLAACEPDVRQPVTMSFDDRGRLWVIQYLQYPTPAG